MRSEKHGEDEPIWEFSVSFPAASQEDAERVTDDVLLAVCGGKNWKHKRLFRWLGRFGLLDICPRWFVGAGPYEIGEDGEPPKGVKRHWAKPQAPSVWITPNWNTNAAAWTPPATWTITNTSSGQK